MKMGHSKPVAAVLLLAMIIIIVVRDMISILPAINHIVTPTIGIMIGVAARSSSSSSGSRSSKAYHRHHPGRPAPMKLCHTQEEVQRRTKSATQRPPHNPYLYHLLQIPYNATILQIQRSYRRLSRLYHPDKFRWIDHNTTNNNSNTNTNNGITTILSDDRDERPKENRHLILQQQQQKERQQQLALIRAAYDILQDDTKRFLYHRHGLFCQQQQQQQSHFSNSVQQDIMSILYPSKLCVDYHSSNNNVLSYDDAAIHRLHTWMGFSDDIIPDNARTMLFSDQTKKEERIQNVVLYIVERIRPILEGSFGTHPNHHDPLLRSCWLHPTQQIALQHVLSDIAQQCDQCKFVPLGASIIRCIGRAYKYEGRRILRQYPSPQPLQLLPPPKPKNDRPTYRVGLTSIRTITTIPLGRFHDTVRNTFRHWKHVSTAAIAGSRVLMQERTVSSSSSSSSSSSTTMMPPPPVVATTTTSAATMVDERALGSIHYNNDDQDDNDSNNDYHDHEPISDFDNDMDANNNEEMQMHTALLESLQIEALWKVYKIELDDIIRQAARQVLWFRTHAHSHTYINPFLPSYLSDYPTAHSNTPSSNVRGSSSSNVHGYIGSSPGVSTNLYPAMLWTEHDTTTESATMMTRRCMAIILIRIGEVMVERSKVGTSWMR
jgi:curved DNA-binding protein CbpA